jgi:HAD superfamily hydrolase (TIGR01484 family)
MSAIRLIVTDLDGTIIGNPAEFSLYGDFRDRINELRQKEGAKWAICTGRSLSSFRRIFSPMRLMEIRPDYVIIRHAYIYNVGKTICMPNIFWNLHIFYLIWNSEAHIRDTIDDWYEMMRSFPSGMTSVFRNRHRLWMSFESEDGATKVEETLRQRMRRLRYLQIFRRKQEVDVRAVPFTKGLAVSELAQHLGVDSANVLAIGDGHNDISMLDPRVASMTGCPANAKAEVIETVHNSGGHVARGEGLRGVMDILRAYMSGTVNSSLPDNWVPMSELPNHVERKHRSREPGRFSLRHVILLLAAICVVVLVFANFKLMPMHRRIMKPYQALIEAMEKAWRHISG